MATLRDEIGYYLSQIYLSPKEEALLNKLLDHVIIKKFTMGGMEDDPVFWLSWKEFGTHKNVGNWWLTDTGYAIGFNENPSLGWSFPVVKLKPEMLSKAISHTQNYFQYYNIK